MNCTTDDNQSCLVIALVFREVDEIYAIYISVLVLILSFRIMTAILLFTHLA